MARNYLVFVFGVFIILIFSFAFGYVSIYSEVLIAGIFALVGLVAAVVMSVMIGLAAREEGGALYVWFFGIAGITAVVLVWYLTRAGVLLKVW
jgi:hypothetical protein